MIEKRVGALLLQRNETIACAESCTGGLVTSRLTDVAGSSAYVIGSVVSYTNTVKQCVVGVSQTSLQTFGAVSSEVASEMSQGIRKFLGASVGVGITGIAGPGGGTDRKPVGLVYISVTGARGTVTRRFYFAGSRKEIKYSTSEEALRMVEDYLRD